MACRVTSLIPFYVCTVLTVHFNGVKLVVETTESAIFAAEGGNVTLPCQYRYQPELRSPRRTRVKWSWVPALGGRELNVLAAIGHRHRTFGDFQGRVRLLRDPPGEASLVMGELRTSDAGRYRCEVIDGLEDESAVVDLELRGMAARYERLSGAANRCLGCLKQPRDGRANSQERLVC